jgi:hypothetical protein
MVLVGLEGGEMDALGHVFDGDEFVEDRSVRLFEQLKALLCHQIVDDHCASRRVDIVQCNRHLIVAQTLSTHTKHAHK